MSLSVDRCGSAGPNFARRLPGRRPLRPAMVNEWVAWAPRYLMADFLATKTSFRNEGSHSAYKFKGNLAVVLKLRSSIKQNDKYPITEAPSE